MDGVLFAWTEKLWTEGSAFLRNLIEYVGK